MHVSLFYLQEIKNNHKLVCRYRTRNNPLLLMMPAKEEDVFLDPWIVMYHDVMSDSEINAVKGLATPKVLLVAMCLKYKAPISGKSKFDE